MDRLTSSAKSVIDTLSTREEEEEKTDRRPSLWESKQRSWGFSDEEALQYTTPQAWIKEFEWRASESGLCKESHQECPIRLIVCRTGHSVDPDPDEEYQHRSHVALMAGPVRLDWCTTKTSANDPIVRMSTFDSNAYPLCVLDAGKIKYDDAFLKRLARIVCGFNKNCTYATTGSSPESADRGKANSRGFVRAICKHFDMDKMPSLVQGYLQNTPSTMTFPGFRNLPAARFDRHQDLDDFIRQHRTDETHPAYVLLRGFDRACAIRRAIALKIPYEDPERSPRVMHWSTSECPFENGLVPLNYHNL